MSSATARERIGGCAGSATGGDQLWTTTQQNSWYSKGMDVSINLLAISGLRWSISVWGPSPLQPPNAASRHVCAMLAVQNQVFSGAQCCCLTCPCAKVAVPSSTLALRWAKRAVTGSGWESRWLQVKALVPGLNACDPDPQPHLPHPRPLLASSVASSVL